MLFVFISWILIGFLTTLYGLVFQKILNIKNNTQFIYTVVFGLFFISLLASVWAFFYRVNIEFFIVLLLLGWLCLVFFKLELKAQIGAMLASFLRLNKTLKIAYALLFFICLAQSAAAPYSIDNEGYYVQTIKWLNEYGFVKGLANIHVFFGQTSGWHITQSALNFSFINDHFNDLNGFFYVLFALFSLLKLQAYLSNQNPVDLLFGTIPLFTIFFLQFISSPSPDVPIYLMSFLIIYIFLQHYNSFQTKHYTITLVLFLFMMYIKVTPIVLGAIPLYVFFYIQKRGLVILPSMVLGALVLLLFVAKNTIITGYPLYPTNYFAANVDWRLPKEIQEFYYQITAASSVDLWIGEYAELRKKPLDYLYRWITMSKLDGLMNLSITALLLVSPMFIFNKKNNKRYWLVYAMVVLYMLVMFKTSAQYRFYAQLIILLYLLLITHLPLKAKHFVWLNLIGIGLSAIVVFVPINLGKLTNNPLIQNPSTFHVNQTIIPHQNAKKTYRYQQEKHGNLEYNYPANKVYFFNSGNGNLPCTSKNLVEYLHQYFGYYPQKRTQFLKDGFYSEQEQKPNSQ